MYTVLKLFPHKSELTFFGRVASYKPFSPALYTTPPSKLSKTFQFEMFKLFIRGMGLAAASIVDK
jgi:hypothetical protein